MLKTENRQRHLIRYSFIYAWVAALLVACGNPNQRLDEYVFYDGPQFRLKVVRYYRNIPFNQLGEHAVVMCQSENTAKFPAHEQQDAGWRMLGSGDVQGSKDSMEAAARLKDDYEVLDEHTLIAKLSVLNISFDACGHFINWDPGRLPQAMINPVEKPDSCAPSGPVDCRHYNFEGDRTPRYEQIRVADKGQVSFTASSPTFRGVELLGVQTRNNGAVWHVQAVKPDTDRRLQADSIRSLSMSLLDKEMDDTSLMDWLESALPPRSLVIWPDTLTTCGDDPQAAGADSRVPLSCAEIRFTGSEGRHGSLFIAMAADTDSTAIQPSFHSAVYSCAGQTGPISSLAELQECLTADPG